MTQPEFQNLVPDEMRLTCTIIEPSHTYYFCISNESSLAQLMTAFLNALVYLIFQRPWNSQTIKHSFKMLLTMKANVFAYLNENIKFVLGWHFHGQQIINTDVLSSNFGNNIPNLFPRNKPTAILSWTVELFIDCRSMFTYSDCLHSKMVRKVSNDFKVTADCPTIEMSNPPEYVFRAKVRQLQRNII